MNLAGSPDDGAGPRGRGGLGAWRRGRPFWGGLLLILAGVELLQIPLLSLLIHLSLRVIIYVGIGGIWGIVIGGLLVACGLLAWLHPDQRVFYAVAGVLLALASFVVTNLGGFFIGMLLGVTGASLVFAWAPAVPSGPAPRGGPPRGLRVAGLAGKLALPRVPAAWRRQRPASGPRGGRLLALPAGPVLALGLLAAGRAGGPAGQPAGTAGGPAMARVTSCLIPLLCPSPLPSPLPDPAPSVPVPGAPGAGFPSPSPAPGGGPGTRPVHRKAAAPRLTAAAVPATLTAGSALMEGLSYDGVAAVPTADGPQHMLKFSMSSLTLAGGVRLAVAAGGHSFVTRYSVVHAAGHVVLYATRISGDLLGARVTFTPRHPPPAALPVERFTDVTTGQPLTIADSLDSGNLNTVAG